MSDRESSSEPGEVRPLATYGRALRYRWPLVLLVTALGLGLGLLVDTTRATSSSASTNVQVNSGVVGIDLAVGSSSEGVNARAEGQLAASTAVAVEAATLLGSTQTPDSLLGQLKVVPSQPSSSLTFTFSAPEAEESVRGANAFADAYLQVRTRTLTEQLDRTRQALVEQQERINLALSTPRALSVTAGLQAQLTDNAQRLGRLAIASVDAGTVVSPATRASANGLPGATFPLTGLLIGFLLGWTAAVLYEGRRGLVRTEDDLRSLGLPVLGRWTSAQRDRDGVGARLALQLRGRSTRLVAVSEPLKGAMVAPGLVESLQSCGVPAGLVAPQGVHQASSVNGRVDTAGSAAQGRTPGALSASGAADTTRSSAASVEGAASRAQREEAGRTGRLQTAEREAGRAIAPDDRGPVTSELERAPRASSGPQQTGVEHAQTRPGAGALVHLLSVPSLLQSSVGLLETADTDGVVLTCQRGRTRLADLTDLLPDLQRARVEVLGVVLL